MNIQQVLADKRAQLAKLQAQIEMLEELEREEGGRGGRGRRHASTPSAPARPRAARRTSGGRASRGANQQRVLSVLTGTPTRASEIARGAKLSQQGTTQVLKALIKKGMVEQTGRGMYKATGAAGSGSPSGGDGEARAPRAARTQKGARKPGRSLRRVSEEAPPHDEEEVIQRGSEEPVHATA